MHVNKLQRPTVAITRAIALVLGASLFASCTESANTAAADTTANTGAAEAEVAPCCSDPIESGVPLPLPDASLFHLEGTWTDQNGQTTTLEGLRGTVAIATMIFTHCAYACPQIVADLQAIEQGLGADAQQARFLLLSMDPDRDTPEVLKAWAKNHGMGDNWLLLNGDASTVREVAAVLGINYVQTPSGDFSHSNIISVLDRDGVIVERQEGLRAAAAPTVQAVRTALQR